jgi:hypothetical protein
MTKAAQTDCGLLRRMLLTLALALALGGCASPTAEPVADAVVQSGGGGLTPESVTRSFFEDLGRALKDPTLASPAVRETWVERLAGYFAPSERDAQRETIDLALTAFATDRAKLSADEVLTIEIRFDEPRRISGDDTQVLVLMPNASIYMQIARVTDRGPVPYYEQPIALERVIGRPGGAIPTIKVGNRWFLTEG